MRGTIALLTLALAALMAAPADARPWRVVKNGVVTYTDNIDDLPPKMRARILEQREQARLEAAKDAEARRTGIVTRDAMPAPDGRPMPMARPAPMPAPSLPPAEKTEEAEKPPPKTDPPALSAAEERALVEAELAEARAALTALRRKAIIMPDGRIYAERTAAERRVADLEARLKALGRR